MKRCLLPTMLATLLAAMLVPAQLVSAQSDGNALCDLAIAQAGTGQGQFGRYELVSGNGGPRSQVVVGTDGDDVLDGGSGNDILCGLDGADTLYGGSGNDILVGGADADQLYGQSGGDTLYADSGDTVVDGGSGRNQVIEPLPVLTYSLNVVDGLELCDLDWTLTGAEPNIETHVSFSWEDEFGDGAGGASSFDTSPSGSAEGSLSASVPFGNTVTSASALDGDFQVIATAEPGQPCPPGEALE